MPKLRDETTAHYEQYPSKTMSPMLHGSKLFWASEQQVRQTCKMADYLDDHTGMLDYAPTPQGFMWFDHADAALLGFAIHGMNVPLRVFSWDSLQDPSGKLTVVAWSMTEEGPPPAPGRNVGPLQPVLYGRFGSETEDNDVRLLLRGQSRAVEPELLYPAFAMWYRMTLPRFAAVSLSPPTASQAKKATNKGRPSDWAEVTLVDAVSRPKPSQGSSDSEGTGRKLEYRQEVEGFWRMQHYGPKSSLRKKIWVDDYERGPEDAPKRPKRESVKTFK
ncbi:hypothetical protein [Streptomyces sp. H27-C3]|uniref:hypothetical protein n=1 Tax=Streptomyces sp. H27-C3 TaxID=3046305 RepID=UPI0024BBC4A9|nr:hypothetical protein [Streptomyces sp. H27-C3]MDJ0463066.1 hypothetical protein [Streptomyces sp. H27-C3]